MAKKKKEETGRDRFAWYVGAALVGGSVMYFFNKYMRDREELTEIRAAQKLKQLEKAAGE